MRDEVGRRLQMTQAVEQAYYEAQTDFTQPEQIKLMRYWFLRRRMQMTPRLPRRRRRQKDLRPSWRGNWKSWRSEFVDRRRHRAAIWECTSAGRWEGS